MSSVRHKVERIRHVQRTWDEVLSLFRVIPHLVGIVSPNPCHVQVQVQVQVEHMVNIMYVLVFR